jgi:RNA polymerase sigma-70 factor (ECF subfamily)
MEAGERQALQQAMARLSDGERDAFPAVFAALWPVLRAFAARALRDGPLAEDAAQAALLRVFARASEFDASRDALAWALGVAAWEVRTLRRRAERRREHVDKEEAALALAAHGPTPEEALSERQLAIAAAELLGTLRPADAETLAAMARGERPPIAAASFRKRVERALSRLRAAWRARHGA